MTTWRGRTIQKKLERMESELELLSQKWTLRILSLLMGEKRTFTGLRNSIDGISNKVLSEKLEKLRREGLVEKAGSSYRMAGRERELEDLLNWLEKWTESSSEVLVMERSQKQSQIYEKWLEGYAVDILGEFDISPSMVHDYEVIVAEKGILDSRPGLRAEIERSGTSLIQTTAKDIGSNGYLVKPVSREELVEEVKKRYEP